MKKPGLECLDPIWDVTFLEKLWSGTFVTTSKDDYGELRRAIAKLPDIKVKYSAPDTAMMATVLSEKLGVNKEIFQKELEESRALAVASLFHIIPSGLSLVVTGCHWLSLVVTGCHWLPLVVLSHSTPPRKGAGAPAQRGARGEGTTEGASRGPAWASGTVRKSLAMQWFSYGLMRTFHF